MNNVIDRYAWVPHARRVFVSATRALETDWCPGVDRFSVHEHWRVGTEPFSMDAESGFWG